MTKNGKICSALPRFRRSELAREKSSKTNKMRTRHTRNRRLNWTPRVALDDGLTHAIAYFRDSNGAAA